MSKVCPSNLSTIDVNYSNDQHNDVE